MLRLLSPRVFLRPRAHPEFRLGHRRLRWSALIGLTAIVAAGSAGAAGQGPSQADAAATVSSTLATTYQATADARVHESSPTTNYGSSSTLRVDGASDPDVASYLRFTVSGITGSVQRATLRLNATSGTADGPTVSGTSSAWTESGINWNNRTGPTTAVVDDEGTIAAGAWAELDVTALVTADGTFDFLVAPTSSDGADFHSRESTSTSLRPQLVVEALTTGAPVATSPPTISGAPQEGATLAASPGTWNGNQPITFAYQWQRCDGSGAACADIAGATGQTYVLASSDVGATFRVVVTATNADGSGAATSAPAGPVIGAGEVVIAAAGDIGVCGSSATEATAQLLDSIAPTRVLTLGDNAYSDGTDAEFANCYHPTWGRHREKTSPSAGNHDYHTPGASGYFNYFGAAAGDPTKGYYAFDLGAWRLYALNSNCSYVSCSAGSPQEQWLRADLAAHSNACALAYWHHARFSSGAVHGSSSASTAFWQALYDAGADVVLVGHDHDFERFTRLGPTGVVDLERGIREFVVGTGGAGLYAFGPPITGSEVRSMTHGVLKLTLRAGGYTWAFVPIAGSTFTDSGTDTCGTAVADGTPPSPPTNLVSTSGIAGNVGLSWTASTDEVGVVGYDVYRDSRLLGSTAGTTYTDTSAVAGATYAYRLTARDAAGNVSGPSNTVTVTVAPNSSGTLTFAADADARVAEAKPGTNYGTSATLRTDGGSDPDVESYLRFTASGVTGSVQRAILRVHATTGTADGPAAYGTGNGWTETGITWSTRPARSTPAVGDKGAIATGAWVEYDVTSVVSGNGTFSFVLATTSRDGVDFDSRNSNQTAFRPQLVVTYG